MLLNNFQKVLKLVLVGCMSAIEVLNQSNSSMRMIVNSEKILNCGLCNAKSRAVVYRNMSRSRDTILQSLGSSRSRRSKISVSAPQSLGKWACLGHISNPSVKTHNNLKFLTEKKTKKQKQIPSCLNQGFLKLYLNSPWGLNISKK